MRKTRGCWRRRWPCFDFLVTLPFNEPLTWENGIETREWAWCDALFMAPPALAAVTTATGDRKYLDLANRLWWKTTDYLYDTSEHLYFRDSRFFDQREPNGKKVFWSRGNGWVFAGLARMLEELPADHPDRARYVTLFREMAEKIAAVQGEDGYWRASLLDPDSRPNPETSGTGFFVYGLAWGINHGLLDRARYEPCCHPRLVCDGQGRASRRHARLGAADWRSAGSDDREHDRGLRRRRAAAGGQRGPHAREVINDTRYGAKAVGPGALITARLPPR